MHGSVVQNRRADKENCSAKPGVRRRAAYKSPSDPRQIDEERSCSLYATPKEGSMRTDQEFQRDIIAEPNWQPSLRNEEIGVAVKDGVTTLSGNVAGGRHAGSGFLSRPAPSARRSAVHRKTGES